MDFSIRIDPETIRKYISVKQKGKMLLYNPFINKGTAFDDEERENLDLHGLLPPCVSSIEDQLMRTYENFITRNNDLDKFIFLSDLQDRNEVLFYRFLLEHIEETLPVVYTPTVGEACKRFSHIFRRSRGLYISYRHINNIEKVLENYYSRNISVIVVTDGQRILGIGDQGADGMSIPIGKLCLYTLGAGISPYSTMPIMLDVGTNNEERLNDPLYLGLRQKRVQGEQYQEFIDKFIKAVLKVFPGALLQWEDFLKENAIKQLNQYRDVICSFNDDIQGTGAVVLAYIYKITRLTGQSFKDIKVMFCGAGAATKGIADFIVSALQETGMSLESARDRIWIFDSKGLLTRSRTGLEEYKVCYAKDIDDPVLCQGLDLSGITLANAIEKIKPGILIGTCANPGIFDEKVIGTMAKVNNQPVIFPLSNPTSMCECTAEEAIRWSDGKAIVATGSPFSPVEYKGRRYAIAQCNNFFIFPGFGLGITVGGVKRATDRMFLAAARTLADVSIESDSCGKSFHFELKKIRKYSHAIACAVIREAVSEGYSDPSILKNLEETVKNSMWYPEYLPVRYEGR